ncbi:hypothetical protein AALP_AA5G153700 [Arabis alpina]|uniref:Uncharacterized protein n=1 Tax=Arabis alpina TaxID=50452 RepID=A0A087GXA0_ARAAL|nr:hypothetical protein AALP_AA5G153700 [Arabis alpina]
MPNMVEGGLESVSKKKQLKFGPRGSFVKLNSLIKDKKNLLLVGICGGEALKTFTDSINREKLGVLPLEISGLSVVSIEKGLMKFWLMDRETR